MTTVRIPLSGNPSNRDSSSSKDQRYVNCYPEIVTSPTTGEQHVYVVKRDGLVLASTPASTSTGRGIYQWNNHIYTVFDNKLYSDTTEILTLTTSSGICGFTEFVGADTYLILLDGTKGYYITTSNVVTEITDAQFPTPHLPDPVFMDGYLFVQSTKGQIYNCDAGDVTAWASTSYITPDEYPDSAVALCRQNNLICALGSSSIEFFYDAANPTPGSPLGKNKQAVIQYGCAHADSVAQEEGFVVFMGTSHLGDVFISTISGTQDKIISTDAISKLLKENGATYTTNTCIGYLTRQKGHLFYVLTLRNIGRTVVFDFNTSIWSEWTFYVSPFELSWLFVGATTYKGNSYHQSLSLGKVFYTDPEVYVDDSSVPAASITVSITTTRFDGDTAKIKYMPKLEIIGDWQTSTSNLSVSWSDDDYKNFTTARTVDLSKRAYLYRCGSFRRRAFRLTHVANTPLRLSAIECEIDLGVH